MVFASTAIGDYPKDISNICNAGIINGPYDDNQNNVSILSKSMRFQVSLSFSTLKGMHACKDNTFEESL